MAPGANKGYAEQILSVLRRVGPLSRAELVEQTRLGRTTVFETVGELLATGRLVQVQPQVGERGRGRPSVKLQTSRSVGMTVGVDLLGGEIHTAIANAAQEVIATAVAAAPRAPSADGLGAAAELEVRSLADSRGLALGSLAAVGLGIGGVPGLDVGAAEAAAIAEHLAQTLHAPVRAEGSVRLAALAEATWGAGRGVADLLYVHWSSSISAGDLVRGSLLRGAHGAAGQLGHVQVDPIGRHCHCGGRGCLDRVAGGAALLERAAELGTPYADLSELLAAVQDRSPLVTRLVSQAAEQVGRVISAAAVQLDPQLVIIGGELARLGSLVLEPIRSAVWGHAMPRLGAHIEVRGADLGPNASALGALALCRADQDG